MNKVFGAVKAVLVNKRGEVLVLKSSNASGDGYYWDFPGGRVELEETPMQALEREVLEETAVGIDTDKATILCSGVYKGFGSGAKDQILKVFYVVPVDSENVVLSWEHSEYVWFNPNNKIPDDVGRLETEVLTAYKKFAGIQEVDDRIKGRKGYGLVQLIHGHGKGKTTAALGQAIRCAGSGRKVAIIYFDKGGSDHYFEREILDKIDGIDYFVTGRDRIHPETGAFDFSITQVDKEEALRGIGEAQRVLTNGEYDLVILDEINSTSNLGMIDPESVLKLIKEKKADVELVLTGRDPDPRFIDAAHLVTNVQLERHYFYSGVPAREGLDF